jgi:hypothetical protein
VEVSEGELAVSANANADGRWRPSRRDLDVGGRPETDRAKRRLAVGNPPFGQAIEDPAGDVADRLPGHHHVIHAGKPPGMIGTIADPELASRSRGTLTWTRPRLGEHRLDPGPVPGATAVHPGRIVLAVSQAGVHLPGQHDPGQPADRGRRERRARSGSHPRPKSARHLAAQLLTRLHHCFSR